MLCWMYTGNIWPEIERGICPLSVEQEQCDRKQLNASSEQVTVHRYRLNNEIVPSICTSRCNHLEITASSSHPFSQTVTHNFHQTTASMKFPIAALLLLLTPAFADDTSKRNCFAKKVCASVSNPGALRCVSEKSCSCIQLN